MLRILHNGKGGALFFSEEEEYSPVVKVKHLWNKSGSKQIPFTSYLRNQCEVLTINMTTSYLSSHEENKYLVMS